MSTTRVLAILEGLLTIAIGVLIFIWANKTLFNLVLFFGIFAVIHGLVNLLVGVFGQLNSNARTWLILGGLTGLILGVMTMVWHNATALLIVWLISSRAVLIGTFELVTGFLDKPGRWLKWTGLTNIFFGLIVFPLTRTSAIDLFSVTAVYLVLIGSVTTSTNLLNKSKNEFLR